MPFADPLSCDHCESLPPVATDGETERFSCNVPDEDGTMAVIGLSGTFGAIPSRNENVTCHTSHGR